MIFFRPSIDILGHPVGDQVLRQVAATSKKCVREGDVCGRFGGEEFLVLLPETVLAGAVTMAEKVRRAVVAIEEPAPVTITIGVAECDCRSNGQSPEGTRFLHNTSPARATGVLPSVIVVPFSM